MCTPATRGCSRIRRPTGPRSRPPTSVRSLDSWGPGSPLTPSPAELLLKNVLLTPTVVARLVALRAVSGFDGEMAAMEDWDLWMRLALHGTIRVHREPHVIVRRRPASASRDHRAMAECGLAVARRAVETGVTIGENDRRALFGRLHHDLAYALPQGWRRAGGASRGPARDRAPTRPAQDLPLLARRRRRLQTLKRARTPAGIQLAAQ